jgi:Cu/Ag efflux protein CusF
MENVRLVLAAAMVSSVAQAISPHGAKVVAQINADVDAIKIDEEFRAGKVTLRHLACP